MHLIGNSETTTWVSKIGTLGPCATKGVYLYKIISYVRKKEKLKVYIIPPMKCGIPRYRYL
jgi:hypothetical protein